MLGNNEMTLNKATMIKALQFWMDSELWAKPDMARVVDIAPDPIDGFRIKLETPKGGKPSDGLPKT